MTPNPVAQELAEKESPEPLTVFVCGVKCEHDFQGWEPIFDADGNERGGSTVCTKCGRSAFDVSLWEGD